ncbi:structural protein P5 [Aliivibrio fischeri]|uniref:structural protein P5 n=1 Tax=Aliivibrio fischeri TaxID=668 RepID=UPI00345D9353
MIILSEGKYEKGIYFSLNHFLMIFFVFILCAFFLKDYYLFKWDVLGSRDFTEILNKGMENKKALSRGLRNNNPLNIRNSFSNKWLGEVKISQKKDSDFEEFINIRYGFRAAYKVLMTYRTEYNIKTIDGIIRKFSPTNENNTEEIIIKLSNMTGIEKHKVISGYDYINLIHKMTIIESGYKFPISLIEESILIK